MTNDILQDAKVYLGQGLSVIPLNGKIPSIKWTEYQKRLPTESEIEGWFKDSTKNIGIVTGSLSGFAVIDFDTEEAYQDAKKRGLPHGPLVKTGRGYHLYCQYEPGVRNFQKRDDLPGIDLRAEGGQAVAPPSLHENGNRYEWIVPFSEYTLPKIPDWLLAKAPEQKKPVKELYNGSSPGCRNNDLTRLVGSWVNDGGGLDDIVSQAHLWNKNIADPLPAGEVENTVRSIYNKHHRENSIQVIEPQPLPNDLHPVKSFDYRLLPESLAPHVIDICERVQCPPDFVAVGVMVGLGSLIGRKVGIRPQAQTDWTVTANQWGCAVGRPGLMKTPAMEQALAPLKRLSAKANDTYQTDLENFHIQSQMAKLRRDVGEKEARKKLAQNPDADVSALFAVADPDEPTLRRYIINDTSPAALGELHRQNPNGVLVYRDELVSLLRSLDREDQAEGREFYLTGWSGDSGYTFDRIGRGMNLHIPAVCISLLGTTQPGRLAEYVRHAVRGGSGDDGLIQRFGLLVWPDTSSGWKNVDRWPDGEAKRFASSVYDRLADLDPEAIGAQQDTDLNGDPDGIPYLRFDEQAHGLFLEWRTDLEQRLRGDDLHPAVESHLAKYRKLIPSLALIIHLSEGAQGPVSEQATLKALAWSEYLESHALRAYGSITQPETATAKAILQRIRKGDLPNEFKGWEVWRPGWARLSDREQVQDGLRLLVDYGHLFEETHNTGGRPSTIYTVNGGAA